MRLFALTRVSFRLIVSFLSIVALLAGGLVAQPARAQSSTVLANDFDYYADFTGSQVLRAKANEQVIPGSGAYAIEAWINPRPYVSGGAGNEYKTIMAQNQNGEGRNNDRLYVALKWVTATTTPTRAARYVIHIGYGANDRPGGDIEVEVGDGVPVNTWSHIGLSSNGTNKTSLFFNGREVYSWAFAYAPDKDLAPFTIGATGGTAAHFFDGGIDQVKVWGGEMSADQFAFSLHSWDATGVTSPPTLLAHYDFNDRSAAQSIIFDSSDGTANGHHLSMNSSIEFRDVKQVREVTARQIFTFPRTYITRHGGWKVPDGVTSFDALLVGGGGGGGADGGGGGGGGEINQATNQAVTAGTYIKVQIGQGGLAGSHQNPRPATGASPTTAGLAGRISSIKTLNDTVVLSANPGAGGHAWRNGGAAIRAAGGSGGVGGTRTAGAEGGLGPALCLDNASTNPASLGDPAAGSQGTLAKLTGLVVGSGGGGGIAITDVTPAGNPANTGGDGAGRGAVVEATGDASPGFSAEANRGGGGGGSAACGSRTIGYSRADAGNGGSGVVVISIALAAKCFYESGGWLTSQDPGIKLRPLSTTGPITRIIAAAETTPFYGEVAVVGGKIYAADRGRGQLRRMDLDGTNLESLGALPAPGLGVTTDGRYIYATSSSGIARYDTESGTYQQTFIGKGDIGHVYGEISFARFDGVGYIFITNNADGAGERFGRVHAVPVTGTIPAQINNNTHLFSQSKLTGEADRTIGASGLAIIGNTVYWGEFSTNIGTARVYRKDVTAADLPTHNQASTGSKVADATILTGALIRSVSSDGSSLYVQRAATLLKIEPANNHASSFVYSSGMYMTANGTTPTANCTRVPNNVSASLQSDGKVSVSWTSIFGLPNAQVNYRIEYRNNGGAWVQGASAATTSPFAFTPSQALSGDVEVRVATFVYGQLSEFSYAEDFSSTPPAPPPLCQNPMRLEYVVPANTTVTMPLTNGAVSTTVTVRWAQGVDSAPFTWTNGYRAITNTYATAGTYEVQVCGQFTGFGASTVLHPYLTKVVSWGEAANSLTSLANGFRGALILTDVPNTLPSGVTNLQGTFINAKIFNAADVANWNVTNVTNLAETFNGASAFNQNLGSWNVSNVTNLANTFANALAFNNGGSDAIKNWNTSKVTNLFSTFANTNAFNQPIGSWDVSSATNMTGTFEGATAFNQPLSNWNTSNVTSMRGMFSYASKFDQNIGSWDTSKVTNFAGMFSNATIFNNGGSDTIKNWDTSAATTMANMFFNTTRFNQPVATRTFSSGTISAATTVPGNDSTKEVATLTLSGTFAAGDVIRVGNAAEHQVVAILASDSGVAAAIKSALDAAQGAKYDVVETSSTVLTLTGKANGNLANLTVTDQPSAWNVSSVTDMQYMFGKTDVFNQAVSSWNVGNVTNMDSMFWIARAFNNGSSVAGEWTWTTTNKVTNMRQMFSSAGAFKQVPKFRIDALTNATNMLSFSGLTDTQYGTTVVYFRAEYDANPRRALASVTFGASDKTAFCNNPQAAVLALTTAGWTITDKTNRTAGYCTPTVTVTANNGSHVYGNPVPSIGFTYTVSNGSLPTSDWLNEIVCAPKTANNGTALVSKQTVSASYVTECTGPSGTGLGILVNYVDGTYAVTKRPITVQAKNKVAVVNNSRLTFGDVNSDQLETSSYMITSGTIATGDSLDFTLANNASVDGNNKYTTAGTSAITIVGKVGSATLTNYDITSVNGTLTVSAQTFVFTARSFTKVYGDIASFNQASDYLCETNSNTSCATEVGDKTVSFSSAGAARSAAVGSYPIVIEVIPGAGQGTTYQYVNSNGGVIEVVKRKLTVTPTALTVNAGSAVPTYTFTITGFADGEGVGNLPADYAPTCTSGYTQSTPRGTVLAITCSGGNAGSNYFYDYATRNLTVPGVSNVSKDVPQTIMLAEDETGTVVDFGFTLAPVIEICFATLSVFIGEEEPRVLRERVVPGQALAFDLPLDIGAYEYELFVDGNCAIEATRGSFEISAYVAPTPQPQAPEPTPIVPVPYSGPIINYFSNQQLPNNAASQVVIGGDRLGMITELFIGNTKLTFTRDANGKITITLPSLPNGIYDLRVMYDGGGMLIHQQAFRVGNGLTVIDEGGPVLTRTLRYTNFAGDGFRLPASARAGITRFFTSVEDVNRVVCRGITSATALSASDQRLAERRATEACNLARQLAPTASIELRTSPAAGVGPRFRAVNLFIVYSLD